MFLSILYIIKASRDCGTKFEEPKFFRPFPLPTGPMIRRFQTRNNQPLHRMGLEMCDQRCGQPTLPNAVEMLPESGLYCVFGFAHIMFITSAASNDIYHIHTSEGKSIENRVGGPTIRIVNELSVYIKLLIGGVPNVIIVTRELRSNQKLLKVTIFSIGQ